MGVGKSTLAKALQARLPQPWLILGDETNVGFPRQRAEFVTLRHDHAVRRGNVRAIAAYLDEGLNVFSEWFLWEPWARRMTAEVLAGRPVYIVKLWCALDVAQWRVAVKGQTLDRDPSTIAQALPYARWQYENESWGVPHDLLVETDALTRHELVERVASWLATNPAVRALRDLGGGA
jgi:chloramphenicol 3-O-phosphotransferase